jgi:hypothetical protein
MNIKNQSVETADESIGRRLGLLLRKFQGPVLEMDPEEVLIRQAAAAARHYPAADEELISYARKAFYQIKAADRPM